MRSSGRRVGGGFSRRGTPPTSRLRLSIVRVGGAGGRDGPALVAYLRRNALRLIPLLPGNHLRMVSVALVGDSKMSALHARSHGLAEPTDVLTYPLECTDQGNVTEGEIVICVGEARRRAGPDTMACRRELLLYLLHGLLHLCGMDDREPDDARRMHTTEDRLLVKLGIGPVYSAKAAARAGRPVRRVDGGRHRGGRVVERHTS